jgi:hypothetical protein
MTLQPVPVKFAPYAPDASAYNPNVSDYVSNVIPQADGYGSFPSWSSFGTGLGARCRGGITVRKGDGSTAIYAGTATGLYRFSSATNSWSSVTRSSGGNYAVPDTVDWSFALFGNKLVATNGFDDNQYIDIDAGSNFAALAGSPKAFTCATVGDFLVLGRLTASPKSYAWSGVNDLTKWTPGYNGSDQQEAPSGGLVRNIIPLNRDFVVALDDIMLHAQRVGGNAVFRVTPVAANIGCYAPCSVVPVRDTFFWFGPGGFYEGLAANPIGFEKVDRTVRKLADQEKLREIRGSYDPDRNIIWWIIPKVGGTSFMLGYNWALKEWTRVDIDIDLVFPAISPGYTIGDLATLGYTMDGLPYPFDSSFWTGNGIRLLAGFDVSGNFGWFQATPPAARLETTDLTFSEEGASFSNRFRLLGDVSAGALTAAVAVRRHLGAEQVWSSSVLALTTTGVFWKKARGHTHRFRIDVAASNWTKITGLTAWMRKAGKL